MTYNNNQQGWKFIQQRGRRAMTVIYSAAAGEESNGGCEVHNNQH
jgi:hypothetical protein